MTNFFDILSRLQIKASATVEKSTDEDLQKPDPPKEEAIAILKADKDETKDESSQGNDRTASDGNDREDL